MATLAGMAATEVEALVARAVSEGEGGASFQDVIAKLDECRASLLFYSNACAKGKEEEEEEETKEEKKRFDRILSSLLESVGRHVSTLTRQSHFSLVERLFEGVSHGRGLSPWFLEDESRRTLLDLVTHLIVSGTLANIALDFLVRSFYPHVTLRCWAYKHDGVRDDDEAERERERMKAKQRRILEDVRKTVEDCLRMAPTLHEEVVGQVLSKWPHKYIDLFRSECYITISLGLAAGRLKYAAERVLACIVDSLVELDAEISWEKVPEITCNNVEMQSPGLVPQDAVVSSRKDSDFDELDEADVFEVCTVQEAENNGNGNCQQKTTSNLDGLSPKNVQTKPDVSDPNVEKLDLLMHIALQYVKGAHDEGLGAAVHESLLGSFQRSIFPVCKTRLTQFLVFYSCARQPNCKTYLAFLSSVFLNNSTADETRISALQYLCSFAARAENLPFTVGLEVMSMISNWCIHFCQQNCREGGVDRRLSEEYNVFFAACEALLHSFSFILSACRELPNIKMLNNLCSSCLLQVCGHWSNPLAKCATAVVEEFLQQTVRFKFLTSDVVARLRQMHGDSFPSSDRLFPFNLCNLKQSGSFILTHSMYRNEALRSASGNEYSQTDRDAGLRIGSMGQRSDTQFSQSPSTGLEFGGSYLSEEGDFYNGNSTAREAWFAGNQRPVPIGMKAQELVHTKYFDGFSGSPGIPGSMSTDHSPDISMSLGTSFNDNKWKSSYFSSKKY